MKEGGREGGREGRKEERGEGADFSQTSNNPIT